MRKHDVRKWLHAILDLLPVILIPVFMIYSHRHDVTENVEINYKYQSNEVNTLDDLVDGNIYFLPQFKLTPNYNDFAFYVFDFETYDFGTLNFSENFDIENGFDFLLIEYQNNGDTLYFTLCKSIFAVSMENTIDTSNFELNNVILSFDDAELFANLCDEYDYLPQYTDYNVIESVDTTNSNVMDSFMNNFNNTIQTHFNMGNVFHLEEVYQWFNTNIFGGNAPVVIQSIYNIVVYELVMDLLFLLYGLFMWFIDMIQKLMEKPLNSIK